MTVAARRKWILREWDPASEEQERTIIEMEAANGYGSLLASHAYFDWQYRRNPMGRANLILAADARDTSRIVGQCPVLPTMMVCNGHPVLAGTGVNLLIDERYRDLAMARTMAVQAFDMLDTMDASIGYGFPNRKAYLLAKKWTDVESVGEIPLLVRPLRLAHLAKVHPGLNGWRPLARAAAIPVDLLFSAREPAQTDVEEVTECDASFDRLNEQLTKRFPIMVRRDAAFLQWRYIENPREYDLLTVRRDGELLGYIAYTIRTFSHLPGVRCGILCDFVIRGDAPSRAAGKRLVKTALARMRVRECDGVGALCLPQWPEYRILRKCLFRPCPSRFLPHPYQLCIQTVPGREDLGVDVHDANNWFVTVGDYDAA